METKDYKTWLIALKSKISATQIKAAIAVNSALIVFYWELGKMISEKENVWGTQFLKTLSKDLSTAFPDMKGFSVTNLNYCRVFYNYLPISPQVGEKLEIAISPQLGDDLQLIKSPQLEEELIPQISEHISQKLVDQFNLMTRMPWGHIKLLIDKIKDTNEALFYTQQTIENHWSRNVLAIQIKSNLYQRKGKAITNFKLTLPDPMSDLAQQTLKDPYVFDFMTMATPYKERDIENQLVNSTNKCEFLIII